MVQLIEPTKQYKYTTKSDRPHSFKEILGKEKSDRPPGYKYSTGIGKTRLDRRENAGFRPSLPKTAAPKDKNRRGIENYSRGFPPNLVDVDWLGGTFENPKEKLPLLLKYYFHDDPSVVRMEGPFKLGDGPERWHYCYKHLKTGATIYCRNEGPDNITVLVGLGGSYLKPLEPIEKYRIIQFLHQNGFKPRRCDIMVDTLKEDNLLENLYHYGDNKQIQGVIDANIHKGLADKRGQDTLYLGSWLSDKFYRCYDTQKKHGYEANRLELVLRRGKVKKFWAALVEVTPYRDPEDKFSRMSNKEFSKVWHSFLANYLFGQMTPYDWIDRAANGRVREVGTCDWWLELQRKCLATEPIRIRLATPAKTVQKSIQWEFSQNAPTLAVLYRGFGRELFGKFMDCLIQSGIDRLKPFHHALIALVENEREIWEDIFSFSQRDIVSFPQAA